MTDDSLIFVVDGGGQSVVLVNEKFVGMNTTDDLLFALLIQCRLPSTPCL